MQKFLVLLALIGVLPCLQTSAQKKYGYTILQFRCGEQDAQKDRVYYSPVIELNTLNFAEYTDGVDPRITQYSVRYYNYAIAKWFEIYLKDNYKVLINAEGKYARKSHSVIYNEKNKAACDDAKLNSPCFFLNKEELETTKKNDVAACRSAENSKLVCEVIDL